MKKKLNFFFVFICFTLLTGCYDKKEIEQQAYVIAIGIDTFEDEKKKKFDITFQIANPEVGSKIRGGGSKERASEIVTLSANDFLTAKNTANAIVSREVSLDHTKVLVVSEKLARSEAFIRAMQTMARSKELRSGIQMIVSREKASTFLKNNNPAMETRPHKYFQYMIDRGKETGIIPNADIHRFLQITEGDADLYLAMYATTQVKSKNQNGEEDEYIAGEIQQTGSDQTQFMGSAVFKEGIMIDTLTGEETRLALILDNTLGMKDVLETYPDPLAEGYRVSARFIMKDQPSINVIYKKNEQSKINVNVPVNIEVIAVPSLVNYSDDKSNREKLRAAIEKNLEKHTKRLIEKTQEVWKGEPFYWSLYVRKEFRTIKAYEKADWNKNIYPNAEITVDYNVEIVKFGDLLESSNLSNIRD